MLFLSLSLAAWGSDKFNDTLTSEILQLNKNCLPLQQALSQSSYVSETKFSIAILNTREDGTHLCVKISAFFTGIIAGSCCSDDPTPVDELQEYCELEFLINKVTAETTINLIAD